MNRLITLLTLALFAGPVQAGDATAGAMTFTEGTHYDVLSDMPEPETHEGRTELMEFFWYGCPHCYKLDPLLGEWLEEREDTVQLRLMPTIFNARWAVGARIYYTLEALDRLDLHTVVFQAMHEQGRPLKTAEGISRLLTPFKVDAKQFTEMFRSEEVSKKVEATRDLPEDYGITGVPALVVDGKYRVTSRHATSYQMMLDIVDYLLREKSGKE